MYMASYPVGPARQLSQAHPPRYPGPVFLRGVLPPSPSRGSAVARCRRRRRHAPLLAARAPKRRGERRRRQPRSRRSSAAEEHTAGRPAQREDERSGGLHGTVADQGPCKLPVVPPWWACIWMQNEASKLKRQQQRQPRLRAEIPIVDDSPASLALLALDVFSGCAGVSRKGAPARLLLVWASPKALACGGRRGWRQGQRLSTSRARPRHQPGAATCARRLGGSMCLSEPTTWMLRGRCLWKCHNAMWFLGTIQR